MVVAAQPIFELGTCWQGSEFPIVITFKNNDTPADPPSPAAVLSLQDESNPAVVITPTLTKTGTGVYAFNANPMIDGDWIVSTHGGWTDEETPSLGHLKVLPDPNHNRF